MYARSRAVGCPGGLRFLNRGATLIDLLRGAQAGKWVPPMTERDSPIGDPARGVLLQHTVERRDGLGEPERVQKRDRAVEVCCYRRCARRLEIDAGAADLIGAGRVIMLLREDVRLKDEDGRENEADQALHINLPG